MKYNSSSPDDAIENILIHLETLVSVDIVTQRYWPNQRIFVSFISDRKQWSNFVQLGFKFLPGIFAKTVIAPFSFEILL